jgi:hypothetical protein
LTGVEPAGGDTALQLSETVPAPAVAEVIAGALSEPTLACALADPLEVKYAQAPATAPSTTAIMATTDTRRAGSLISDRITWCSSRNR